MAGLYIHIPFCTTKCAYCDFYSVPHQKNAQRVITAIGQEWKMRRYELETAPTTIYIGGGTPSLLPIQLFNQLANSIPLQDITEYTIEANPDDVNPQLVNAWKANGINRVSMGVQSLIDTELQAVGRRHNAQTAISAYKILRNNGIDNISLDLIYGLPGQTLQSWKYSVDSIIGMHPNHLSAYLLSIEHGTRLYALRQTGKLVEADEKLIEDMYTYLCNAMAKAGYVHYEISNFALSGQMAQHNSAYWDFSPYIGLGPAAHSYGSDSIRRVNPNNITQYLNAIEANKTAYTIDTESETDIINDHIMVSLRTAKGLNLNNFDAPTVQHIMQQMQYVPKTHIIHSNNTLRIPEEYFLTSDAIIRTLLL